MTAPAKTPSPPSIALRLTLAGRVQGIGMRPALARLAKRYSLAGFVANTRDGVELHVEGPAADVEQFESVLRHHLPAAAEISSLKPRRVEPAGLATFALTPPAVSPNPTFERDGPSAAHPLATRVPADVVVCDACLAEVEDPDNRRHRYPFTSCTDCGPRYSIIDRMPYEREQTSLVAFPLCDRCRHEYSGCDDRRFHAQTNACARCGPTTWLRDARDQVVASDDEAIRAAAAAILDGRIVALRGLGGYQLLVDATSVEAVERLRRRKRRPGKPLAVMVASVDEAIKCATLDDAERRLLREPAGPIVVSRATVRSELAAAVNRQLNTIGLMLPTTPLHRMLLTAAGRPLVCTSGNVDGEPLAHHADDALARLREVADVWLEHDRPICRAVDDSVLRVMAGRPVMIRLARGYAPLPLPTELPSDQPMIALGGHQKNAIALCNGAQAVLGPHVGELNSLAARQRFVDHIADLTTLYGSLAGRVACDQHPDYFATRWAESQRQPVLPVQHHHAHLVAGMLEHGWLDRQVIGVALDGSGYGSDGTIWGGEFLLTTATSFERVGHLRPFPLPGGETAIGQPWRVATALVRDALGDDAAARLNFQTGSARSLLPVLRRPNLSPITTSAGRLFDGVAALVLGIEQSQFEGQAAMLLEAASDPPGGSRRDSRYAFASDASQSTQLDWRPLVRQIMRARATGIAPAAIALQFHQSLARAVFRFCRNYASLPVVLGGGVFQNRLLVDLLVQYFSATKQPLGLPGLIPPNDGGLAAGQLGVAAARTLQGRTATCV